MPKVVLSYSPDSPYDDVPEERYNFPAQYLSRAQSAVGDWVLYYEPGKSRRRAGLTKCYFAMAKISAIVPDEGKPQHYYALVSPGNYIAFPNPVPYKIGERYLGATSRGDFRSAVRRIDDAMFAEVVQLGMAIALGKRVDVPGLVPPVVLPPGMAEEQATFEMSPRDIVEQVTHRRVRDAAFARQIVDVAYGGRCAITGLRIVNGLGRAEVEAAHIRPVAADGPDSPRNGIALSRTVHWMFDRGLLSLEDTGAILIAKGRVPDAALRLINPDRSIIAPSSDQYRPHPLYLRYHREHVFKG